MWHDRIVYYRDFAYTSRRLRMANGSIGHVPAATFAEYVDDPFLETPDGAGVSESSAVEQEEDLANAPPAGPSPLGLAQKPESPSRCLALRPGLAHRLYSHRLHVRAKAKLQRDRLLSGPMMDMYVGEARRHWSLHRNLLCHHSERLETELEGDGKDRKRKDKLELADYDPAGFELLVKWLYQGKLDDVSDMADASQKYEYAVSCHKLHLLCIRLDMPQLKNVAMDQYRKGLNEAELVPDADEIDEIYRKSPSGSPFRKLMTRVAARQIMDPGSERDVETYRKCFDNNPDFAIDLVKAIRHQSGGILLDDPTEPRNPCEYHDHEDGPNCHIKAKAKAKAKQTPKTLAPRTHPSSTKSTRSTNSDQPSHLPHPPPNTAPHPQPPPRQARLQDRASVGPLRRRLTSPAISTVGTSPETATACHPPNMDAAKDREKWRRVTPPERKKRPPEQNLILEETKAPSRPVPEEPLPSSGSTAHPLNETLDEEGGEAQAVTVVYQSPTRRRLWEWARLGTGRLNIIGRLPHPEWSGPAPTSIQEAANHGVTNMDTVHATQDDFSIPWTTATEPGNEERQGEIVFAKMEGLGIVNSTLTSPSSFAQTKQSSDELIAAASSTSSPARQQNANRHWANGETTTPSTKNSSPLLPDTPTPQQRKKRELTNDLSVKPVHGYYSAPENMTTKDDAQQQTSTGAESDNTPTRHDDATSHATPKSNTSAKANKNTSSPRLVPTYKIALAPNIVSSAPNATAS
ncbi:hypothetical protein ACEQ8H_008992 [Pleosporales sp. CAS-2024a]